MLYILLKALFSCIPQILICCTFNFDQFQILSFVLEQVYHWWILCFYLSENIFISPSFLKGIFTGYRILGWYLFLVDSLKVLSNCLMASLISDDCHSNYIFPTYYMLFSSDCFHARGKGGRIWFSSVWLWHVWAWTSLSLSCLGFIKLYEPVSL